jgi:prepilin-type processing-associated H-X9-DG protein
MIVLYENPEYQSEGTNVAYCDGHVEWKKPEEFIKALRATYEKLGKPMPTVEFKKEKKWFKGNLNFDTDQNENETPASRPTTQPSPSKTLNKNIPFKCTNKDCGTIELFSIGELRKMQEPVEKGPMMGPMVFDCPKCKKHSLTQAVECPACEEIFILNMDPKIGVFDDKCPKCGKNYVKAWKEKYPKRSEKE